MALLYSDIIWGLNHTLKIDVHPYSSSGIQFEILKEFVEFINIDPGFISLDARNLLARRTRIPLRSCTPIWQCSTLAKFYQIMGLVHHGLFSSLTWSKSSRSFGVGSLHVEMGSRTEIFKTQWEIQWVHATLLSVSLWIESFHTASYKNPSFLFFPVSMTSISVSNKSPSHSTWWLQLHHL